MPAAITPVSLSSSDEPRLGPPKQPRSPSPADPTAEQRSSYVSFPDLSSPLPSCNLHANNAAAQRQQPFTHLLGPKTLLGRFKSAFGGSAWVSPAIISRETSSAATFSRSSTPSLVSAAPRESDSHLLLGMQLVKPKVQHVSQSDFARHDSRIPSQSPSVFLKPPTPQLHIAPWASPTGSPSAILQSHQPRLSGSSPDITLHYSSPDFLNELEPSSLSHRPFPENSSSSRTPFHLNLQAQGDTLPSLTSSDALLRSLVLVNSSSSFSNAIPPGPTFSHIPGFPLGTETLGDDTGSLLSSSRPASSALQSAPARSGASRATQPHQEQMESALARAPGKGLSKEYWMPDKDAKECYDCSVAFTSWRRKHHCRICGSIFCARCASNLISGNRFASTGYIRVCNICLSKLEPESNYPHHLNTKNEVDDDNQSTSNMASTFQIFGSRSHCHSVSNGPLPTKCREIAKAVMGTSYNGQLARPSPAESHESNLYSRLRNIKDASGILEGPNFESDDPNTSSPNPAPGDTQPPTSDSTASSAPFRKGLTDEEQAGHFGVKSSHSSATSMPNNALAKVAPSPHNVLSSDKASALQTTAASTEAAIHFDTSEGVAPGIFIPEFTAAEQECSGNQNERLCTTPHAHLNPQREHPSRSLEPSNRVDASSTELPLCSRRHLRSVICQFLSRARISPTSPWETVLTKLLLQLVSDPPRPDFVFEDMSDIRRLIKIKRIPGGVAKDCEYVRGIVFTKNVVHKKMRTYCKNPRVLAMSFPLEFQRLDGYTRFEPLMLQERQYLKTLVRRITSLRPDILLVGGDVSRIAIEYLVDAGVTVMRHVKPTVLQAVARCTRTPTMSSMDKLLNHLQAGQCDLFRLQTLFHPLIPAQHKKTLVRFEGCDPTLGGTIILRGGDMRLLARLKSLMNLMVRIAYSLRLETAFLKDEGTLLPCGLDISPSSTHSSYTDTDIRTILSDFKEAREQLARIPVSYPKPVPNGLAGTFSSTPEASIHFRLIENILRPYEAILLSGSPRVKFDAPFVLRKLRDLCLQLKGLCQDVGPNFEPPGPGLSQLNDQAQSPIRHDVPLTPSTGSIPNDGGHALLDSSNGAFQPHSEALRQNYMQSVRLAEQRRLVEEQRAAACYYLSNHRSEKFCPVEQQRIVVQEAVIYSPPVTGRSYTCREPHLRVLSFYSTGDPPLGQLIQMLVACRSQLCTAKNCGQPKSLHETVYTHGTYRASLKFRHSVPTRTSTSSSPADLFTKDCLTPHDVLNSTQADEQRFIMMQGYCPTCGGHTAKVAMSSDAWRLSFGKFLQLCFYSSGLVPNLSFDAPNGLRLPCRHDSRVDLIRMFFYQGYQIDFCVQRVSVYEAIPPSLTLVTPLQAQCRVLDEEYQTISQRAEVFFNSVKARAAAFSHDLVAIEKQSASEEAMRELLNKVELDALTVQSKLKEAYEDCIGTNGVRMNTVRKSLLDKAIEWDQLLTSFESRFAPVETRDIRRLTSAQFKKLFFDQGSVPGSPDRLFPRLSQVPSLNSQKYTYTCQSEVESDHGAKGSCGSFRKAFPSPSLKSVANALAFALPTSIPVIGASEAPSEKEKLSHNPMQRQEHHERGLAPTYSSEPPTPLEGPADELAADLHHIPTVSKVGSPAKGLPAGNSLGLPVPPVDTQPGFASRLTHGPNTDNSCSTSTAISGLSYLEMHDDIVTQPSVIPAIVLPSNSAQPSHFCPLASETGTSAGVTAHSYPDQKFESDDDSKSDSTVVNVQNSDTVSTSRIRGLESRLKEAVKCDPGAVNNSEIDLQKDGKRLTIRARRARHSALSKQTVANMVQKFEAPETSKRATGSTVPLNNQTNETNGTSCREPRHLLNQVTGISAFSARPSLKRGKSEVLRSASNVVRGKRPVALHGNSAAHGRRVQQPSCLASELDPTKGHVNRTAHPHLKVMARDPSGVGRRIITPKLTSDNPRFHNLRKHVDADGQGMLLPSPGLSPAASSRPRPVKHLSSRRNRSETRLPVPSHHVHKRLNLPHSKVMAIARQFDKMNRDAERDGSKQIDERRSRPRPIAHARSSVQAFSSLTAAVESDLEDDECGRHPAEHDADDEGDVLPETQEELEEGLVGPQTVDEPQILAPLEAAATSSSEVHPKTVSQFSSLNETNRPLQPPFQPKTGPPMPCSPSPLVDSFRLPPSILSQFSDTEMSSSDTGRHSIIKTLSSLWSYRATDLLPLEYPHSPTEHQSTDNLVLIREDEPSSVIAYTLSSYIYQKTLRETRPKFVESSEAFMPQDAKSRRSGSDSAWRKIDFAPGDVDMDEVLRMPAENAKPMQFCFDVTPCTVTCKVFFMHQFEALRKALLCGDIVESLARCHKWDASGGKSGQKFLKSKDGRYLLKGISKAEIEALTKFAPAYFEYLSSARRESRPIALAKMLGIFQVAFVNRTTNHKWRLQVQVIENLWVAKPPLQIYDLKGLTRNRTVSVTGQPHEVLLDGNFCEVTRTCPILVNESSLSRLQASLHNDTLFLANNNVMDYSLAVGFDEEGKNMHVGIIDYLQTYSWDKRLETLVKELGGSSKEAPTIITPSLYKARFRRAMARYFVLAPDGWFSEWKPFLVPMDEEHNSHLHHTNGGHHHPNSNPPGGAEREGAKYAEPNSKAEDAYVRFLY